MKADAISNPAAEWSVVASMVTDPSLTAEIVGTQLAAEDFLRADARLIYATAVERFYSDQPIEALSVVEPIRKKLAEMWSVAENVLPDTFLDRLRERDYGTGVIEHAGIVKRLSTSRKLLSVAEHAQRSIGEGVLTPEEVAGKLSADALAVTSGTLARSQLLDWMGTGREYAKYLRRLRLAREKGIEMAVYTGLSFIDDYTKGVGPSELCFVAGPPGVGKSIVGWKSAEGFAVRQMKKAQGHRVGTLICSLEMSLVPSTARLAQSITGIDGVRLREGDITDRDYEMILREWKAREDLPLYFNFASNLRLSQLRGLVVEAIRKYNVGFVLIDHFRMLDPDKPITDPNLRDEVIVRFLKENIATDLNVAVMCLAHTIKLGGVGPDQNRRPRLADLRGSGQIAANADFVAMMHRPGKEMSVQDQLTLGIQESDAELIWAKSRHTGDGTAYFSFRPETMTVRAR